MKKPARTFPNQQLKQARVSQGWSQEYVAQAVGTDAFTVSRWERGVTAPSMHFRPKLCALFGMNPQELGLIPRAEEESISSAPSVQTLLTYVQTAVLDPAIPPLPTGEVGLVGRDELLRNLKLRLLTGKQIAHSALNGLPGVGKTTLAIALAHDSEIREHFSGGILWAGLGRKPDVLGLLSRWGTVLNSVPTDPVQRSRPESWASSIHAAIGQRRMLLILDDAWEIADALALRVGGTQCAHLVTTRFPEIARRFAGDDAMVVRELEDTDGRLLLMRLASDAIQTEPQEAQALVAAVGGLPLALTLLGHFLRAQSHSGQPRRIRAALERLRNANERLHLAEPQTLIGNHPSLEAGTPLSLQAMIGLSDQQISSGARAMLRALAMFPPKPNTFSEEAAVKIGAQPVEMLDDLSDAGLLESSGPARYTLHQTIADYARNSKTDPELAHRFAAYFVEFARQHTIDYAAQDLESYNILEALELAHEHSSHELLIQGVQAYTPFLITRGLYAVAEKQLQRMLAAAQYLENGPGQVAALLHLGRIAETRSKYALAGEIWQEALALARQQRNVRDSAYALRELGELARLRGQPEQARQFLNEALEALTDPADQEIKAGTLRMLGNLLGDHGEREQARAYYTEALDLSRNLGDKRGMALILASLGVQAREEGLLAQARECYEEALTIFRELGDNRSTSSVIMNLGNLARHQGHTGEADLLYQEALSLSRKAEHQRSSMFILLNLASLHADQGQFDIALPIIQEVIPFFQSLQDLRNLALAYQVLGDIERELGRFNEAHEHLQQSLIVFQDLREQRQIALSTRLLGLLARQQKALDEAHTLLHRALTLLEEVEDQYEIAQTRYELGALARLQGRLSDSYALCQEALVTMRALRHRRSAAHILSELGRLALQQNQTEEALRILLSAGVGLRLIKSFKSLYVEETIAHIRVDLGEERFLAIANQVARSTPELAYGLSQASWRASLQYFMIRKETQSVEKK